MAIEVGKIMEATERLHEKLGAYNALETEALAKQAAADAAHALASQSKVAALASIAELQGLLHDIQARHTPGSAHTEVEAILDPASP